MKFIIEVPEGNTGSCALCPFVVNECVCEYLGINEICDKYDFTKLHIEEYENRN